MKMPSWALDLVTTRDGVSWDLLRVGTIVAGVAMIAFQAVALIVNKQPFNPLEFGSGVAAILAGGGIGIGAKRKDEPDA